MSGQISFRCPSCGQQNAVEMARAGQRMLCAHCGVMITAPAAQAKSAPKAPTSPKAPARPGQVKFACSKCGHRHFVDAARVGEVVACEACGQKLRVPGPAKKPAAGAAARPTAAANRAQAPLAGTKPAARPPAARRAPLQTFGMDDSEPSAAGALAFAEADDEMESAAQGESLAPRGAIASARATATAQEEEAKPKKKKKKKRKKKGKGAVGLSANEVLGTIAAVGGTILVVVLLGVFMPDLREPMGITIAVAGAIVAWVGKAALFGMVREEGTLQYLMFRFVPFYALIFILRHWHDTKEHLMIWLVGGSLLMSGLGLWGSTFEESKGKKKGEEEAEEAEEARLDPSCVIPSPLGHATVSPFAMV